MSKVHVRAPKKLGAISIDLPTSKSISNRLLIIQALADHDIVLNGLSQADDTQLLMKLLQGSESDLNAKNAGTVFRFLTAYLSLKKGTHLLTGSPRMMERPIKELVDALRALGTEIVYRGSEGFPPIEITARDLHFKHLKISGNVSSQFVSAIMLIGPYIKGGIEIELSDRQVSRSYIAMTFQLMKQAGADVSFVGNLIRIQEKPYQPVRFDVERDWSSAHFWMQFAILDARSKILLKGLKISGLQGDEHVVKYFSELGMTYKENQQGLEISGHKTRHPESLEMDLSSTPDAFPALVCTAAALDKEVLFRGINHLQYKESNRVEAVANELGKVGAVFEQREDALILKKGLIPEGNPIFKTYADHRLAMAFAMLAPHFGRISIENPEVVQKSYPGFWKDLQKAGFELDFDA